ncbi:MAG: FAD-dependent oxidoreductase [Gammaproteobacteria bacterium]
MSPSLPAVVLGAGVNGLGVARSLAKAHVPVWLLDSDPKRPEMHTRMAKPLRLPAMQGEPLIEGLVSLGKTVFADQHPVMLLTQEEVVKTVSRNRKLLSPYYRLTLPEQDVLESLLHKEGFQRIAERLGAPIPPLVHIRSLQDLPALQKLRFPVVIKPGERHVEYSRTFKKAYQIDDREQAEQLIRSIMPVMTDIVVQEWIEGPDSNIFFCLQDIRRDGSVAASFTGRKIRSWPPQVGGTASCTSAPEADSELTTMTTQFFQQSGVVGLASMEYKRDARTRNFRMVEPTVGRTDYQEEVATLHGVNLPYAAYCAELDMLCPAPVVTKRPVVWRVRSEDAQSAAAHGQHLKYGYPRGAPVTDALWRWNDPKPFLVQSSRRVRRALRTRTAKIVTGSHEAKGKI